MTMTSKTQQMPVKLHCFRCPEPDDWWPKDPTVLPKACPKCKNRLWNIPRQKKSTKKKLVGAAS